MAIKITQEHLEHARIPMAYWNVYLKKIPDTMPYKREVKIYLANMETFIKEGVGIYLWSEQNSTGKTAIGTLALRRAMELGYSALYIPSDDYKEALINREMFSETETVQQRAMEVDVLLVDDVGKEYRQSSSGFAETKLQSLISYRAKHRKVTIFTSNIHPKELRTIYGNDLAAMLQGCMKPIEVKGMDWNAIRQKEINALFKQLDDK